MADPDALLERLDAIGRALAATDGALALIGLGSVGRELERLDAYSDLDFFVIVEPGRVADFLDDLAWLSAAGPIAYRFRNTASGYKLLYADGIFCEFAVFAPDELARAAYPPGRIVWRRDDVDETLAVPAAWPPPRESRTVAWQLGEALTNLYVGLGRYHRGEKLSAFRFIQQYAVDRVIELAEMMAGDAAAEGDWFDGPRRFERRYPSLAAELPALMQGYERGPESAAALLALLERHFAIDPAMRAAILALLPGQAT